MVWIKVNEKNVVIDVSDDPVEGWLKIDTDLISGPLDIVNRYNEFIWKVVDGHIQLRTNGEIMQDEIPEMIDDLEDEPTEAAESMEDRIAALEQELELLISGEVE